ncbi:MAG: Nudix family hydrolase [Halofilum sp. (in: g-proteobacteria)]|nr:Nudix family hydrolase [Halofilum sp. (in: g-proteobacteria)]
MAEPVEVAVAVLRAADGRVLVAERAAWRHEGGRLEFPGGKLDPGEEPGAALARELEEELGVRLREWVPLLRLRHRYDERAVVLHVCEVQGWAGEPHGAEGQPLAWCRPEDLRPEWFPDANRPILAALQLPPHCLVTPAPEADGLEATLGGLHAALAAGVRLVQLRAPQLGTADLGRFVDGACATAAMAPAPVRLLLNSGDPAWLQRCPGLAGLHLSARAASLLRRRPLPEGRLLSCACHDAAEIRQAERLGADLLVIGHVGPTPSHAEREPLGWDGLEALTAATTLPAYAIGGLGPDDVPTARRHGAIGIAAIRGLWPGA